MPPAAPLLLPVLALALWTQLMLFWMAAVRGAAVKAKGIDMLRSRGGRGQDLEGVVEPRANWPAHNYTHLHEQPTLFYAVALAMVLAGGGADPWALGAGWAYVAARVAHSIYQARINLVRWRFALFAIGTAALVVLSVRTIAWLLGIG